MLTLSGARLTLAKRSGDMVIKESRPSGAIADPADKELEANIWICVVPARRPTPEILNCTVCAVASTVGSRSAAREPPTYIWF